MNKHLVLLSGFTQSEAHYNGITELALKLRSTLPAADNVWVHTPPYLWRRRENTIGAFLQQAGAKEVMIVGYSWGGNKAIKLAEELQDRGIKVPYMVLSDPVRRPAGPAVIGKIPFMRELLAFKLPENVGKCHVFLQEGDWPTGFPVRGSFLTEVETTVVEEVPHDLMDNLPEFHRQASEFLQKFSKEK
ncbi:MAG: alpha/beta hydrolase [Hyphomicrobiaceae bacterium]|nr:MAG: alpha/beta hydrolase [Hyphomicrobiaceae bacterium]